MRITISLFLFFGLFFGLAAQHHSDTAEPSKTNAMKVVEHMPRFYDENCSEENSIEAKQCSQRAMLTYVYSNINYPTEARKNGVEGMAVVSFIVDAKGWIHSPKIIRDPGAGTGQEALRVIEKMMSEVQWIPGTHRGEAVEVEFNLPIKFALATADEKDSPRKSSSKKARKKSKVRSN